MGEEGSCVAKEGTECRIEVKWDDRPRFRHWALGPGDWVHLALRFSHIVFQSVCEVARLNRQQLVDALQAPAAHRRMRARQRIQQRGEDPSQCLAEGHGHHRERIRQLDPRR